MENNSKVLLTISSDNEETKKFTTLLSGSISFTPKEKLELLKNWNTYPPEKTNIIISSLEKEEEANYKLEKTYPEEFKKRKKRAQEDWAELIKFATNEE